MPHEKFNVAHLERLDDPERLETLPPDVMWAALGNPAPQTIVDIGAGTGLFACQFAELSPEAIVYAVDTEPAAVRWMIEHRPASMCSRLRPILGREHAIPLATGEADLTVMINLHHELVDPVYELPGSAAAHPDRGPAAGRRLGTQRRHLRPAAADPRERRADRGSGSSGRLR